MDLKISLWSNVLNFSVNEKVLKDFQKQIMIQLVLSSI